MPTYELYTPDEVDGGLYARVKLERKEREEMKIQEGTMVETEFKVRIRCTDCSLGIPQKRRCDGCRMRTTCGQTNVSR